MLGDAACREKKRGREYQLSVQKNRGHWEDPLVEKQENCVNTMGFQFHAQQKTQKQTGSVSHETHGSKGFLISKISL